MTHARVAKRAQPGVAPRACTIIYQQTSPEEAHAQLERVVEQLREPLPQVAAMLEDAGADILAYTSFPVTHFFELAVGSVEQPAGALEQGDLSSHRRGGHLSQPADGPPPGGAVLAEQHDEWAEVCRYLTIPNETLQEPRVLQAAD